MAKFAPIYYCQQLDKNLTDFGIEVPLQDDRASKTFSMLSEKYPGRLKEFDHSKLTMLTENDLRLVHDSDFVKKLFSTNSNDIKIEIEKAYELVDKDGRYHRYNPNNAKLSLDDLFNKILFHGSLSAYAMEQCLKQSISIVLGGGMHHAMTFGGRGFCLFNDIIVGIRKLQQAHLIRKALIIDVDAHKGDGQAEITREDNLIYTFSIHQKNNWPLDDENKDHPSFIPSNLDITVDRNENYLEKLQDGLGKIQECSFDICIVVNGADPYEKDILESSNEINLSLEQILERDKIVFNYLRAKSIPVTYLIAGGYGPDTYKVYFQFYDYLLANELI